MLLKPYSTIMYSLNKSLPLALQNCFDEDKIITRKAFCIVCT